MAGDALSSWNDAAARGVIVEFVERTTRDGSRDWVPVEKRTLVSVKNDRATVFAAA